MTRSGKGPSLARVQTQLISAADLGRRAHSQTQHAAGHRIQQRIIERAMIFERGALRSIVGLAYDPSPSDRRGPSNRRCGQTDSPLSQCYLGVAASISFVIVISVTLGLSVPPEYPIN
jgi:hypothetical protein